MDVWKENCENCCVRVLKHEESTEALWWHKKPMKSVMWGSKIKKLLCIKGEKQLRYRGWVWKTWKCYVRHQKNKTAGGAWNMKINWGALQWCVKRENCRLRRKKHENCWECMKRENQLRCHGGVYETWKLPFEARKTWKLLEGCMKRENQLRCHGVMWKNMKTAVRGTWNVRIN